MSMSGIFGEEAGRKTSDTSPAIDRNEIDDLRELSSKTRIEDPNERAIIDEILSDKPRPLSVISEAMGIQLGKAQELRDSAANKIKYRAQRISDEHLKNPFLITLLTIKVRLHPTEPKVLVPIRPVMPPRTLATAPEVSPRSALTSSSSTPARATQTAKPAMSAPSTTAPVAKKTPAPIQQAAQPQEQTIPPIKRLKGGYRGYAAADMSVGIKLCYEWISREKTPLVIYNEQMKMIGILAPAWLAKTPLQDNAAVLGITPLHTLTHFFDDAEERKRSQAITMFNLRDMPVIAFIPSGAKASEILKTSTETPEVAANWADVREWANKKPDVPQRDSAAITNSRKTVNAFMAEKNGHFFIDASSVDESSNALIEWMEANERPMTVEIEGKKQGVIIPLKLAFKLLNEDLSIDNENYGIDFYFGSMKTGNRAMPSNTIHLLSRSGNPKMAYVKDGLADKAMAMAGIAVAPAAENVSTAPSAIDLKNADWNKGEFLYKNGEHYYANLGLAHMRQKLIRDFVNAHDLPVTLIDAKHNPRGVLISMTLAAALLNGDKNLKTQTHGASDYFIRFVNKYGNLDSETVHTIGLNKELQMAHVKGDLAQRVLASIPALAKS